MKETNRFAGDMLLWLQLSLAWGFTLPQVVRSLQSTAGMTITWSVFCTAFVTVNLFLSLSAYRETQSRKAGQLVLVYANWLVLWLAMFAIAGAKGVWTRTDTLLSVIVISSVAVLLMVRRRESLKATLLEPITRGCVSLILKSTPQLYIAYCILDAESNDGLSGWTLAIGHLTVILRIVEIALAAKQDGWTKKNIGLMVSESGNELTWFATTLAWLVYW